MFLEENKRKIQQIHSLLFLFLTSLVKTIHPESIGIISNIFLTISSNGDGLISTFSHFRQFKRGFQWFDKAESETHAKIPSIDHPRKLFHSFLPPLILERYQTPSRHFFSNGKGLLSITTNKVTVFNAYMYLMQWKIRWWLIKNNHFFTHGIYSSSITIPTPPFQPEKVSNPSS